MKATKLIANKVSLPAMLFAALTIFICGTCTHAVMAQGPILNNPGGLSQADNFSGGFQQAPIAPWASTNTTPAVNPAVPQVQLIPAVGSPAQGDVEFAIQTDYQTDVADETQTTDDAFSDLVSRGVKSVTSREGASTTIQAALLFGALSLAPAILLMTTCYIRIVVVLGLLKQAFGAQQLPPTQILTALSLFITILIMAPIWNKVKTDAIDPYIAEESTMTWDEAWTAGVRPVKDFMCRQIDQAGNTDAVAMFYKYAPAGVHPNQPVSPGQITADIAQVSYVEMPNSWSEVPLNVVLPAFVLSELKVAFLLGFQIYLPFLVLDLVVSSMTVSMGMLMLPPTMVSFPLKLILFVMVDGWNLVVGMLLQSFGPFG